MTAKERESMLWIVTGVAVGLLFLNYVVIDPAMGAWSAQSDRIAALQKKVVRGRTLLERETLIRNHWAAMLRSDLSANDSAADADATNAINRWTADSRGVTLMSVTPQFQEHEDAGYDAFEYRVAVTGDQAALGHFLYDVNTDPMPCSLEECELTTRDAHGAQLTLSARFSFVRIAEDGGTTGNAANTNNGRSRSRED